MAIKFKVFSVFEAKDKHSKAFNKMGKNAKKFGETGSKAFKKLNKSATKTSSIMKGILGAGAVTKGLSLVSAGITSVTTDFLNFDQAITSASAKFKGLDLTTQAGIKTLDELKKTARLVGAETEFNAAQAASGLDFLALAGFNAEQAMSLLPGVTNLATVANVDLATATDIASDSLGAFGLMTKDSAKLAENFTRVQDVMAKTTASSNTNLIDLFESVKKGAPAFTAAGQSLESFNALTGVLANSGVKGSEAGTQLRNVMLRLAKPTKESAAVLDKLGIKTTDAKGNFLDVIDVLADFEKGLKGMGTQQKSAALATVFGARSVTGINILLKEGTGQLRSYRQSLIDSSGAAEKMAKIMRSSLMNRLKSLGSAATEVGFQLFSAFDKQGATAIDKLTQFIRKIDLTPFIDGIKLVVGEVQKMKPHFDVVIDIVKSLWKFLGDSGIIDLMIKQLKLFVKVASVMSKIFKKMWFIIKPIVEKMAIILKPILDLLGILLDSIGKDLDKIGVAIDPVSGASTNQSRGLEALNVDQGVATQQEKQRFETSTDRAIRLGSARAGVSLQAPPKPESGTNDINLDISGAPETATAKQKTSGAAKPVSISGLGRPAALQGA